MTNDPDGINPNSLSATYSWQIKRPNREWEFLNGLDSETIDIDKSWRNSSLKVSTTYKDSQGFLNTVISASSNPIAPRNWGNGALSPITGGPLSEGNTITAGDIQNDPDGVAANPSYKYQWQSRLTDDSINNWSNISEQLEKSIF